MKSEGKKKLNKLNICPAAMIVINIIVIYTDFMFSNIYPLPIHLAPLFAPWTGRLVAKTRHPYIATQAPNLLRILTPIFPWSINLINMHINSTVLGPCVMSEDVEICIDFVAFIYRAKSLLIDELRSHRHQSRHINLQKCSVGHFWRRKPSQQRLPKMKSTVWSQKPLRGSIYSE
jgi:hypothetical protein